MSDKKVLDLILDKLWNIEKWQDKLLDRVWNLEKDKLILKKDKND